MQARDERFRGLVTSVSLDCLPLAQALLKHYEDLIYDFDNQVLNPESLANYFDDFVKAMGSPDPGQLCIAALPLHDLRSFFGSKEVHLLEIMDVDPSNKEEKISDDLRLKFGLPNSIKTKEDYNSFVKHLLINLNSEEPLLGTTVKVAFKGDMPREYVLIAVDLEDAQRGTCKSSRSFEDVELSKLVGNETDKILHGENFASFRAYAFVERNEFERVTMQHLNKLLDILE